MAEILLDEEGRTFISNLESADAELCIEILDLVSRDPCLFPSRRLRSFRQGLAEHNLETPEKQAFLVMLGGLAATHGRLPESMMIEDEIEVSGEILASGGFADVRTGTHMGHLVAVKTMRVPKQDDLLKIRKVSVRGVLGYLEYGSDHPSQRFCKEVVLWHTLSHPNILKLTGVQGDMDKGQFVAISEWMACGNIMEYIQNNHVNRLELVRGFTVPATPLTEIRQTVARGSPGSELPPRLRWPRTWGPQRRQYLFDS